MAGFDASISGAEQLRALSRDLKAAGSDLRKQLPKAMREAAKPIITEIRTEALATLPAKGGLAALVSKSRITTKTRTTGDRAGVRVTGVRTKDGGRMDLKALDRGRLRHKTFGHRPWVNQAVSPGFWSKPFDRSAPHVRRELLAAIDRIREEFSRG